MATPELEIADIVRWHGDDFLHAFPASWKQRSILTALASCRTADMGGHTQECDACGHRVTVHHSCRDRHCPKCQAAASADWYQARAQDLLPVGYFHVVFTLPEELRPVCLQNKRLLYDLFFRAAGETLLQIAADPKHLGARIGFHSVLHTWSQTLLHHPHVHCLIPGGGLSADGGQWISCRKNFFLPVAVLQKVFRGKFMEAFESLYDSGQLQFHGQLRCLRKPTAFRRLVRRVRRKKWVVYAKPPFANPETVLKYLARYTHRVAISNRRILDLSGGKVTFSWKDYRDGNRTKQMRLPATEFLRRFLLHAIPRGFQRIRHYGLLANRVRCTNVAKCRALLDISEDQPASGVASPDPDPVAPSIVDSDATRCPRCKKGRMILVQEIPRFHPSSTTEVRAPP